MSIADTLFRERLQCSTSDHLLVPTVKLSTVGRRAFPVARARILNDLPLDVHRRYQQEPCCRRETVRSRVNFDT